MSAPPRRPCRDSSKILQTSFVTNFINIFMCFHHFIKMSVWQRWPCWAEIFLMRRPRWAQHFINITDFPHFISGLFIGVFVVYTPFLLTSQLSHVDCVKPICMFCLYFFVFCVVLEHPYLPWCAILEESQAEVGWGAHPPQNENFRGIGPIGGIAWVNRAIPQRFSPSWEENKPSLSAEWLRLILQVGRSPASQDEDWLAQPIRMFCFFLGSVEITLSRCTLFTQAMPTVSRIPMKLSFGNRRGTHPTTARLFQRIFDGSTTKVCPYFITKVLDVLKLYFRNLIISLFYIMVGTDNSPEWKVDFIILQFRFSCTQSIYSQIFLLISSGVHSGTILLILEVHNKQNVTE